MNDQIQQAARDLLLWLSNKISHDGVADFVFGLGMILTDHVFVRLERIGL